jgi:hypothetical protein
MGGTAADALLRNFCDLKYCAGDMITLLGKYVLMVR